MTTNSRYINTDNTIVYNTANDGAPSVGTLYRGDEVEFLDQKEYCFAWISFFNRSLGQIRTGWVYDTKLATSPIVPETGITVTAFPDSCYGSPYITTSLIGECTSYCRGRSKEVLGVTNLPTSNAEEWIDDASGFVTTSSSDDLIADSIACFGSRHVVYVEAVADGNVYFTEANWYAVGDSYRSNGQWESGAVGTDGEMKSMSISDFKARSSNTYQGSIILPK